MQLKIGDKLQMIYDFGYDQTFDIVVTDISPMAGGTGRAYPKILDGAGRGILDDITAHETLDIINRMDRNGKSDHFYMNFFEHEMLWDYRDYSIKSDNIFLKGRTEQIAETYSYFEQFKENVNYE